MPRSSATYSGVVEGVGAFLRGELHYGMSNDGEFDIWKCKGLPCNNDRVWNLGTTSQRLRFDARTAIDQSGESLFGRQ